MICRILLYVLIYTYVIFFGTPLILVVVQFTTIAGCILALLVGALRTKLSIFPPSLCIYLCIVLAYLLLSMMLGLGNAETPISVMLRFSQNFLLTFTLPLLGYAAIKLGYTSGEAILRHIFFASLSFAVIKCVLIAIIGFSGVPIGVLQFLFIRTFHAGPTFGLIAPHIVRFMTPSDFILPFALFYGLHVRLFRRSIQAVTVGFCIAGIFFAFSRFIWLEAIAAVGLRCLFLPKRVLVIGFALGMIFIPLAASYVDLSILEKRFSSNSTVESDMTRAAQYRSLSEGMGDHFFVGHGLASFTLDFVRDPGSPYTYELQWIAFLYQLGTIGVSLLIGLLFFVAFPLIESATVEGVAMFLLFGVFAVSGFANPALIGRAAGAIYLFVIASGIVQLHSASRRRNLSVAI